MISFNVFNNPAFPIGDVDVDIGSALYCAQVHADKQPVLHQRVAEIIESCWSGLFGDGTQPIVFISTEVLFTRGITQHRDCS